MLSAPFIDKLQPLKFSISSQIVIIDTCLRRVYILRLFKFNQIQIDSGVWILFRRIGAPRLSLFPQFCSTWYERVSFHRWTINQTIIVLSAHSASLHFSEVVSFSYSYINFTFSLERVHVHLFLLFFNDKFVCAHNRFIMCCFAFNVKVMHMLKKFVANCF